MSKLLLTYILIVGIATVIALDFDKIKNDAAKFTEKLIDGIDKKLKELEEAKSTNSTALQKIDRGIVNFEQSAQIHNLYGIRDTNFAAFLSAYFKKSNIDAFFLDLVKDMLLDLTTEANSDWKSFKFLYTKNDKENVCVYSCIIAQHDLDAKKINWIYTEIETTVEIHDIFLLTTTEIFKGKKKETQNIVSYPSEVESQEIDLLLDFFDVIAFKTFGKYFGIESNISLSREYENGTHKLTFLA